MGVQREREWGKRDGLYVAGSLCQRSASSDLAGAASRSRSVQQVVPGL